MTKDCKILAIHAAVVMALFLLQFILPEYHHLMVTRIMVLTVFALGYNVLFGYTGLLSLGHAMFFGIGLYGAGLTVYHLGWSIPLAFFCAALLGALLSLLVGCVALRTTGVAFMIVTLMFSQVAYLSTLFFTKYTRVDEGIVLPATARSFSLFGSDVDLTNPAVRYNLSLLILVITMSAIYRLVTGKTGRALIAVRENESQAQMLGYNTFTIKLQSLVISGTVSATAGATYGLLFAYVGSSFAAIQYSIDALLFTLLGGPGTLLGPVLGTFMMFYIIDFTKELTAAYLLVTGIILVLTILFFPKGILGSIKQKWLPWLP